MGRAVRRALSALLILVVWLAPLRAEPVASPLADQALGLFSSSPGLRRLTLASLVASARKDLAPVLILALRFAPQNEAASFVEALETVTGAKPGPGWDDWMRWQEASSSLGVPPDFAELQSRVYSLIDPEFRVFFPAGMRHEIRLEEITWGGVVKDGIPALDNPVLVPAAAADYLADGDLVFGIAINGDVRAYPLRILDWHEMFNDVVGGVPVSLAYCTLCGSGILFESTVEGREKPFVFGSSGFLYRSNKLMFDRETHSLWNQFTGRPVTGALAGSGLELKTRPVVIARWGDWKASHPDTKVLRLETGHKRDYRAGAAYGEYFASPELMFPTNVDQSKLKQKDFVFALRSSDTEKAWPLTLFEGGAVVNDSAGIIDLVLIGDAATRSVRAYRSEGLKFDKSARADEVLQGGDVWKITEDALVSPAGRTLARLPGHIAYWFAWSNYYGGKGELASPK